MNTTVDLKYGHMNPMELRNEYTQGFLSYDRYMEFLVQYIASTKSEKLQITPDIYITHLVNPIIEQSKVPPPAALQLAGVNPGYVIPPREKSSDTNDSEDMPLYLPRKKQILLCLKWKSNPDNELFDMTHHQSLCHGEYGPVIVNIEHVLPRIGALDFDLCLAKNTFEIRSDKISQLINPGDKYSRIFNSGELHCFITVNNSFSIVLTKIGEPEDQTVRIEYYYPVLTALDQKKYKDGKFNPTGAVVIAKTDYSFTFEKLPYEIKARIRSGPGEFLLLFIPVQNAWLQNCTTNIPITISLSTYGHKQFFYDRDNIYLHNERGQMFGLSLSNLPVTPKGECITNNELF